MISFTFMLTKNATKRFSDKSSKNWFGPLLGSERIAGNSREQFKAAEQFRKKNWDNKDFICERQVLLTSFNSGGNKDEGAQEPRQLAE